MKKIIIALILSSLSPYAVAQDLIVTNEGDSINCKIKQTKDSCIYFTFKYRNIVRNTLVKESQVKFYKIGFYANGEVPYENALPNDIYPHLKLAITPGYSYRTAKTGKNVPSAYKDYVDELRSGFHLDVDLTYYFKEMYGIGMKYSFYNSKNSGDGVSLPGGGYGDIQDNVSVTFAGPVFSMRTLNQINHNSFYCNMALGYLGYKDDGMLGSNSALMKGSTVGLAYDMGYDVGLSKSTTLGFQVSYLAGTMTQYEMTYLQQTQTIKLDKDNYESLARLDFSVGIRFNW